MSSTCGLFIGPSSSTRVTIWAPARADLGGDALVYRPKRVLVTGAVGFIGSHPVESVLQESADVRALVRCNSRNDRGLLELVAPEILAEVDVVPGDLRDVE